VLAWRGATLHGGALVRRRQPARSRRRHSDRANRDRVRDRVRGLSTSPRLPRAIRHSAADRRARERPLGAREDDVRTVAEARLDAYHYNVPKPAQRKVFDDWVAEQAAKPARNRGATASSRCSSQSAPNAKRPSPHPAQPRGAAHAEVWPRIGDHRLVCAFDACRRFEAVTGL
jgi:hypothetical protein